MIRPDVRLQVFLCREPVDMRKSIDGLSLLVLAQREEVEIRIRDGSTFSLRAKCRKSKSPFDVPGVSTSVKTSNILDAVRGSRER